MAESQGKPNSHSPRVLVVEDDTLTRLAISKELRRLGMAVVEADSADEALAYLAGDGTIDLVFSDIQMPGLVDGLELARQLRLAQPQLPVILTSGNVAPQEPDTFPFIPKPFDCKAVALTIIETLSEAAAIRSPGRGSRMQMPAQTVASETGYGQLDIERSAKMLIDHYRASAEEEARTRVQSLARQGDVAGVAAWGRIWAAVKALQRLERPEGASPPLTEPEAARGSTTFDRRHLQVSRHEKTGR